MKKTTTNKLRVEAAATACLLAAGMMPMAHAYVGPGAGFAFVGTFLALFIACFSSLLSLLIWPIRYVIRYKRRRKAMAKAQVKRVVILGLDGLDPILTDRWIAEGKLPNLAKLAAQGSYSRLQTTYPSISPVAWSSFMTGVDPARRTSAAAV